MHSWKHKIVHTVISTHAYILIGFNESQMFMEQTHTLAQDTFGQLTSFHSTISSLPSALSPAASLDYCAAGQKRGGWMEDGGEQIYTDGGTKRGGRQDAGTETRVVKETEGKQKRWRKWLSVKILVQSETNVNKYFPVGQ